MRIRAHLALIVTATLIPVIVFSAFAVNLLLDAERKAAVKTLRETARSTALIVDRELGIAEAGMRVLATSQYLSSGDLDKFYLQAKAADRGSSAWTVLLDAEGRPLIDTGQPLGAPLAPAVAPKTAETVIRNRATVVSNLSPGGVAKPFIATLAIPVPVDGGQRYVLATAFSAAHFNQVFTQKGTPANWTVAIIDRDGNFIARSRKGESMLGKPARPELIAAARTSADGELRHNTWEGVDSYDVYTHSALSGWTVAVAVPADVIESAARHAVMVAALGLLAAVLAAAGTAALVSRRLVESIQGVDAAAAALVRGETPATIRTGVEEMDNLASSISGAGLILMQEKMSRQSAETERARLLENERLARQLAEKQNKAKDQFLAMLGHELRNPLSAISGAIAVMKARDASAALNVRAHTIIERQSNHLSHIVDDLLDLSRMSMGKITLDKQPLDLAAVVNANVDTLHAAGRVGQCDIDVEAEPVWIDADRIRLDQIIGNVIGNALKFSSRKGRIDIMVMRDVTDAVLTIRDFGIGISEQLMPNIFDAFVQGAAQTDHAFGGLGIGLNLVRQLVQLHSGTITIESAGSGEGTTVMIRLPLSRAALPPDGTPSAPVKATPLPKSTVLLIEDNADSREMMAMLLGMLGYKVLEAANGEQGLKLARREQPAIAVVDIGLPDMDGYEVARQLRTDTALQNMTLIALTGYGQEADRQRALAAGFDSHLVKPLDMDVLVNTIISHQAKQQAHSDGNSGADRAAG